MMGRSRLWLVVASMLVWASSASAEPKRYTMDDLRTLASSESWLELCEHLRDIKPSRRTAEWNQLVKKAAHGWLSAPQVAADSQRAAFVAQALVEWYPRLKKDAAFMSKRADVGIEAYRRCFSQSRWGSWCNKHLWVFVSQDPSNAKLAFKAGKLVRVAMAHYVAAPYFHLALVRSKPSAAEKRQRAARCSDADVRLAVVSALAQRPGHSKVKPAQEIAFGPCWASLRESLVSAIVKDQNTMHNACSGLLDKGALKGVRRKKCTKLVRAAKGGAG